MIKDLSIFISDISLYSIALPIAIGLIRYFHLIRIQKAILFLVLLSVGTEVVTHLVRKQGDLQNIVYYVYTIGEYLIFTYVFFQGIWPSLSKNFFRIISTLFIGFVFVDMIWISGVEQFNNYSTAIESLLLIFLSLVFFYKTLKELKIRDLEKEPLFWVSTGVLLYFSGSLFIFLFTNYVNSSNTALFIIWGIHAIFRLLLNLFYGIALWIKLTPSTHH